MLSTHWMNESEPFAPELRLELEVADLDPAGFAALADQVVLPTSPGRTTCRSSMKKTLTAAGISSSIWGSDRGSPSA